MSRLTEKFSHNGFEYMATGFGSNNPYAIDKLGKLEDLEEQLGCPLEVIAHLVMYKPFYYEDENGNLHTIDSYELTNKNLIFYMSWKDYDIYLGETGDIEIPLSDYKQCFWLREDKSE